MRSILSKSLILLASIIFCGGIAHAALQEKPVLDGINNTVAVLRYFHKQVAVSQANLELVQAARTLTKRQLDAQQQLYKNALAAGDKDSAQFYSNRLVQLQQQMSKLDAPNFDKLYADRIAEAKAEIKKYTSILDSRLKEYDALFGKRPIIDLSFKDIYEQYGKKRANAAEYLDLDQ